MMTRSCGLPKLEYQILTSWAFLGSALFESGDSPTVRAAASLVSNIASVVGPVSFEAKDCCARTEHGTATIKAAANERRLMHRGLFRRRKGHKQRPHQSASYKSMPRKRLPCGNGLYSGRSLYAQASKCG